MRTIGRSAGWRIGWEIGRNPAQGEVTTNPPASHGTEWVDADVWTDTDTWEE